MDCHILIIDDDRDLCTLIKECAAKEAINADYCQSGMAGLAMLEKKEYHLILLDVMMPGLDGFQTLEKIRSKSNIPILMLTSKDDTTSKINGLRSGADDYLTKPFNMEELIARIISLIRRYTRFNGAGNGYRPLIYEGLSIDFDSRSVTTKNGTFDLPPKEFDVLLFCAKNQGRILTKQQIYEEVWKEAYVYDDSNIMAIISRLRKKIEPDPGAPFYIQTIKGIGYRFNKEV
ncbi:DNA-binding response regulator [Lacrimispora amygdalina]|uniref:Stage 0 sporulation protein A homolog n=1 Tax=Lacrimispora amygdalina TaxID=253257 RepID=A0ABQ5MA91_9FIRM